MAITSGNMPDITPPQIVAGAVAGIPILAELARAFGIYDLSIEQQDALSNAVTWAGVFAGALIGGDALLRLGRNLRKGQVESAIVSEPGVNPSTVEVVNSVIEPRGTTLAPTTTAPINPATKQPGKPPPIG